MVISSPCLIDNKELTSPEQTSPGKDFSNPFIVDSLLKTIWSSMHHVFTMKHWLVQSKRLLHNMVAFLEKSSRSAGFHQIIDFLNRSHIYYALSKKPDVCVSFIKQFWRSAEVTTAENREVKIAATIDGHSLTITEGSLRRHLKLDDQDDMHRNQLQQHTRSYLVPSFSMKVFNNMKRPTKAFSGQEVALFPTMLDVTEPSTSPSRITSSPSPSPEPSPSYSPELLPAPSPTPEHIPAAPTQPSPTQPSSTQPSPGAEHHLPTPNESPIHVVHSHGSDEGRLKLNELTDLVTKLFDRIGVLEEDLKTTKQTYSSAFTKLILRVKKLEAQVKIGKARRRARIVHSNDEDIADDSPTGEILSDAKVQEKDK
ncbi:hypothetical protein Tco_0548522 [Tanacetum coccineum]